MTMEPFAVRGKLVLGSQLVPGALVVEDGRITAVLREPRAGQLPQQIIEAEIVAPGLIDLQVNGGFGVEVGADSGAIRCLAARLPETGVTAFLPTVVTAPAPFYHRVFAAYDAARHAPGARSLGLHLEGPFLSPQRKGAHRLDIIEAADEALFEELLAGGGLRLMTLAPERQGAHDRIRRLRQRGVLVSLGHTDATYEEFVAGIDAGATMATHLYNAMSPFGHRAPSAIGAALVDDRVTVGLIADGIHSHLASLQLALRAKGPDRIALVTDMMPAAAMPPGSYELGGQTVIVDGEAARLEGGTLAGSILTFDQAIRRVVQGTDATPAEAIHMATEVPARLLGLNQSGRLIAGCDADLALFDAELNVQVTIINGQIAYRREGA